MKQFILLFLPCVVLIIVCCAPQEHNEAVFNTQFDEARKEVEQIIDGTKEDIVQNTTESVYDTQLIFILESAHFSIDSLQHAIDIQDRRAHQEIDERLQKIIYETEQDVLELKEIIGKSSHSFYDDFVSELKPA